MELCLIWDIGSTNASNAATTARTGSGKFSNENDSECSSVTSDSMPGGWVFQ